MTIAKYAFGAIAAVTAVLISLLGYVVLELIAPVVNLASGSRR